MNSSSSTSLQNDPVSSLDASIARRLAMWEQMLLDLSKRNRLLYFKPDIGPSVRSPHGVKLSEPECDAIWDRLARLGNTQSFCGLESEIELLEDEWGESDVNENIPLIPKASPALKRNEIRAEPEGARLGRLLTNLRTRARTSFEEQGIVTLFAAFGFLRWKEEGAEIYSPLLLVPVELVRASASEPYRLRRHEEEVLLNPALKWKLESEFKVVLPEAPSLDEKSLAPFFARVEKVIAKHSDWMVMNWVYAGLFSFHKIAMFRDLRDNAEFLKSHHIVRALASTTSADTDEGETTPAAIPADIPSGAELDRIAPEEMALVIDADSSQHQAILAARRGLSFVLQGPPGTGKSQTITNIIAECLETEKKVLFVSEKMAALEVVHKRLRACGLGDFCLEAHSHKANKKEVIYELDRTLRLARLAASPESPEDHELERLRDSLNAYVRELHTRRLPSQLSIHDAMGFLARVRNAPDALFSFAHAASTSPTTRAHIEEWLREWDNLYHVAVRYNAHPWRGVHLPDAGLQTSSAIAARARAAMSNFGLLSSAFQELSNALNLQRFASVHGATRLLELARLATDATIAIPTAAPLLQRGDLEPLRALAHEAAERSRKLAARRETLLQNWTAALFDLPHDEVRQNLEAAREWMERAGGEGVLERRGDLEKHLGESIHELTRTRQQARELASTLGVSAPVSLHETIELSKLEKLVAERPRPLAAWFQDGALSSLETHAHQAQKLSQEKRALENGLVGRWHLDRLSSLPCDELATNFATKYTGFFARFSSEYKTDRACVISALKEPQSFETSRIVADLQSAHEWKTKSAAWQAQSLEYPALLGTHFEGENTDWSALLQALNTCRDIITNRQDVGQAITPELIAVLCGPAMNFEISAEQNRELEATVARLHASFKGLHVLLPLRDFSFSSVPLPHAPLDQLNTWLQDAQNAWTEFFSAWDRLSACQSKKEVLLLADCSAALQEAQTIEIERLSFEAMQDNLSESFGGLFQGAQTAWPEVLRALDWGERIKNWFAPNMLDSQFLGALTDDQKRETMARAASTLAAALAGAEDDLSAARSWFPALQIENRPPDNTALESVRAWFEEKLNFLDDLDDWLRFDRLLMRGRDLGLANFCEGVLKSLPSREDLSSVFWRRFWTLWLDEAMSTSATLQNFAGAGHEIAVERFANLDNAGQARARERLRALLSSRKPVAGFNTPRSGEIATLQYEAVKKTRHLPLRQLFEKMPNLLQALKPCMLMSPLSVAQFLPSQKIEFDVVVFDEASQICPEDAVGAISRAKQVIVVGDNKQLPPTRFFGSSFDEDEDDFDAQMEDVETSEELPVPIYPSPPIAADATAKVESILDECAKTGLPQLRLRWHYRSRHEELIAFSNAHFYEHDLMTFPCPWRLEAAGGRALEWEKVEGFYVPGGKGAGKNANTNRIEAARLAELAAQHVRSTPHESLGIIAFNEAQRRAIEEAILKQRRDDPALDNWFSAESNEAFFVKNLENVQGDERDVIFFSVGFGPRKMPDGTIKSMLMNFGPLNRVGGERRLNVAVTRARTRVKIVSSFDPADIDLNKTKARGSKLLRNYIEFAKSGAGVLTLQEKEPKATSAETLLDSVAHALEVRGLQLQKYIGLGEFRVDIAIEDAANADRFVLGILCDGANYVSAATARDRDRLRPQVLNLLGWRLHHVWSPDWVRNPTREIEKILSALEAARAAIAQNETQVIPANITLTETVSYEPEQCEEVEAGRTPSLELKPFVPCRLQMRGPSAQFYELAQTNMTPIVEALCEVVETEGPVNTLVATRRVVAAWEMTRAGAQVVSICERAITIAVRQGFLKLEGENWLWSAEMERSIPRGAHPTFGTRPIEEIALEELQEGALQILEQAFALSHDQLIDQTARLFGFKQTGRNVRARLKDALLLLQNDERAEMTDNGFCWKGNGLSSL